MSFHKSRRPNPFSEHPQAASMVLSTILSEAKDSLTSCGRGQKKPFAGKVFVSEKGLESKRFILLLAL